MKVITFDKTQYGLFVGKNGHFIISSDDCVHSLHDKGECVTLRTVNGISKMKCGREYSFSEIDALDEYQEFTLPELESLAQEVPVKDFVDYWGIKDRIHRNYNLLISSMKEIGADAKDMPEWGA